ncbi:MAG TPA: hypothetical protein VHX65_02540 [Pirellulales bacterium]|jgi:hypothetical protein|nr:hypothetical protein [Pirellulales bacterium]
MLINAAERPELPPFEMPDRFRTDIAYFITPAGESGVAKMPAGEYWVRLDDARRWLDDGVLSVVSPLDGLNRTEIELSDEQEAWLRWMVANRVEHVRLG